MPEWQWVAHRGSVGQEKLRHVGLHAVEVSALLTPAANSSTLVFLLPTLQDLVTLALITGAVVYFPLVINVVLNTVIHVSIQSDAAGNMPVLVG